MEHETICYCKNWPPDSPTSDMQTLVYTCIRDSNDTSDDIPLENWCLDCVLFSLQFSLSDILSDILYKQTRKLLDPQAHTCFYSWHMQQDNLLQSTTVTAGVWVQEILFKGCISYQCVNCTLILCIAFWVREDIPAATAVQSQAGEE